MRMCTKRVAIDVTLLEVDTMYIYTCYDMHALLDALYGELIQCTMYIHTIVTFHVKVNVVSKRN